MMDVLPQIYDLDATQSVCGSILEAAMRIFRAESSFIVLNEMPYKFMEANIQKNEWDNLRCRDRGNYPGC